MNIFDLKNLTVTAFSVYRCNIGRSDITIPPRDFHSLSFRISGRTEIIAEGKSYISEQGAVTYVPKGLPYAHIVRQPSEVIALHFNVSEELETGVCVVIPENCYETERLFVSLAKSWEQNPVSGNIKCLSLIYGILTRLNIDKEPKVANKNHRIIEPAVEYIRKNYTDSGLSVSYLSDIAGVSEAYFR
ncbi:MAG: hypothetical protein CVU97_07565, partial [Firmicutes bacterium HGW-Firmicutes-21]